MDRWTMHDLERTDDLAFAVSILNQRKNSLNPYSPLANKLAQSIRTIEEIKAERDRFIERVARTSIQERPEASALMQENRAFQSGIGDRNCNRQCTGPDYVCPNLLPDFGCKFDLENPEPEPCDPCQPTQPECGECEYANE